MAGAVTFKFNHAAFTPALVASDLKGVAHFRPSEIAVDGIDGKLAGGHVTGALAFRHDLNGLLAHAHVVLAGADAATIIAPGKNAVDGELTIDLQCDSIGPNPVGLVGALHGSGTVIVANAHFHGFDPAAFEAAIRAADDSRAIEQSHIQAAVSTAMANGRLAVPQGTAALTITAGRVSLANATLPAQNGAALSLNGALDLNTETVDARMTLSGPPPANALIGSRPELLVSLKGALAAPQRTLDISALTGWLTLRSAELQTRRIQSIEADRRDSVLGPVVRPQPPAVHEISRGTMVETTLPANVPPPPGTHVLERLQTVLQPAAPDANHPPAGSADHGPAPLGILPQLFGIKPAAPRPPVPRTNNGAANTVPAERSRLDTSVRPQN
jgi:large subunit ribosomal protein L24